MLPAVNRPTQPPVTQRPTPRQRTAVRAAEHEPERIYARNEGVLRTRRGRDFTAPKGLGKGIARGSTLAKGAGIGLSHRT